MKNFNQITILLLNLAVVTTLSACVPLYERNVYEKEVTVNAYMSDDDITDRVAHEMLNDSTIAKFDISISTLKNEVQLCGFVDSVETKTKAGNIAKNISGVKHVRNNLIIRPKGEAASRYIRKY